MKAREKQNIDDVWFLFKNAACHEIMLTRLSWKIKQGFGTSNRSTRAAKEHQQKVGNSQHCVQYFSGKRLWSWRVSNASHNEALSGKWRGTISQANFNWMFGNQANAARPNNK